MKYIDRFGEFLDLTGQKFLIYEEMIWKVYKDVVQPLGPVSFNYSISREEAKFILNKLNGILIKWTDGFGEDKSKEWYAVICDKFLDLSEISSKNRSEIRRGLRNCTVDRVDVVLLSENGFDVFISAFERYRGVKKPSISKIDFKNQIMKTKDFEDIIHYFGVFHENKIIGYSQNYIYDDIIDYSTVKFHPDYLKLYPSYALFFTMNKYYLEERRSKYVNDGFRSILHQTNIQRFLTKKFNFRNAYTNLNIVYKPYLQIPMILTFPFKNIIGDFNSELLALYKLEQIRRKCLKKE